MLPLPQKQSLQWNFENPDKNRDKPSTKVNYWMSSSPTLAKFTKVRFPNCAFMQQGTKFTEGLTWMAWFLLVLWFDVTHSIYREYREYSGTNYSFFGGYNVSPFFPVPFLSSPSFLKYSQLPPKNYLFLT